MKKETTQTATRTLSDGTTLWVSIENNKYHAKLSSDIRNLGFDEDTGIVRPGETADSIADGFELWFNDNLNV